MMRRASWPKRLGSVSVAAAPVHVAVACALLGLGAWGCDEAHQAVQGPSTAPSVTPPAPPASIAGRWGGGFIYIYVELNLTESGGVVNGTGHIENDIYERVPAVVTGRYQAPVLSLRLATPPHHDIVGFDGAVFDGVVRGDVIAGKLTRPFPELSPFPLEL